MKKKLIKKKKIPCFFYDLTDICSLISGSSAFFESSLYIWKFLVHIQLKPSLKDFEHYLASMWNECSCMVIGTFFGLPFFCIGMKTDLFQSCGHCWVFQICWHSECNTLTAPSFRIWNSSTWIPSPPLALFIVILPSWSTQVTVFDAHFLSCYTNVKTSLKMENVSYSMTVSTQPQPSWSRRRMLTPVTPFTIS